jgi:hypothetical protein
MPIKREYEPYTIEITKKFSSNDTSTRAVERFRDNPFGDEDAILRTVVGSGLGDARIIITWGKWGQFPQELGLRAQTDPALTEEVTRHYRVEPAQ